MQTIQETIEQLHGALRDYIEATYHISARSLIARRKELLNRPGVIHQVPYLESTPRYQTGEHFADMEGLPPAALEAYLALSKPDGSLPRLIYDPPYKHQSEAVRGSLIDGRNLIIMTGTGSGKTESFLLPILGKLAREAKEHPHTFSQQPAMRALILYPMNALVNDQLGRLRALFGDPRLVALFKGWTGRPPRFARYTSRTPYAGIRTAKKDSVKLKAFDEFYAYNERRTQDSKPEEQAEAKQLLQALKERGKWPSKPNLAAWLGEKGSRWQNPKTGEFVRAITLPDDSELLTRHEVQAAPPDLLVTNYSMLEYMLMRPIERPIFDRTHAWLESNSDEKFLVVLDEAHLYRGAAGAEVALLLRRLRNRLGISTKRFQVIGATASFNDHSYAPQFGAQLSGMPAESFNSISGDLDLRPHDAVGSDQDANILGSISLQKYYDASTDLDRLAAIKPLLDYRDVRNEYQPETALHHALADFGPMSLLVNTTMKQAVPITELGRKMFPTATPKKADSAVTALMSLGSIARLDPKTPGLLPCRIHCFFRGLPGLWVCMDPDCSELAEEDRGGICGKMYSQPRERCECGARVLELYTCQNCGTAYARAYTDDIDEPSALWSEPGQHLRMAGGETSPLLPLDLLLESPALEDVAEPADYDLETGRLNPPSLGPRNRTVYVRSERVSDSTDEENDSSTGLEMRGQFVPCAVCGKTASFGRSYVQDHQTKGDQPFQALVARQLQIQPPAPVKPTHFAPLQGRKVLVFSDSRQVAARLAPNLQMYSVRDSLRPLIAWGYRRLQAVPILQSNLNLEDLYLAVLLASKTLNVRLRPEMKAGESFGAELIVENAVLKGETEDDAGLLNLCMEIRNERPPEALLDNIVTTVQDRFLGFEALALASIAERSKYTAELEKLPSIPGVAESPEAKVGLARAWLRCWQGYGFWLSSMPPVWWRRPRSEGTSIRGHKGKFKAMDKMLMHKSARKIFWDKWSPALLAMFTQDSDSGFKRLRGSELTLLFNGKWTNCASCKSVHRPVPGIMHCLDCGSQDIRELTPISDPIFLARKGFYRKPVVEALGDPPRQPMALIAGEHTAQLNAPQNEDVYSKAEENELLFQDIAVGGRSSRTTAIDVLSSTTTMEVGIDIGALSGVALRNMPPSRANYQQRSGRAGRRGNAVATVVAFGSADSHDEHYFVEPDGMIRGKVVDPKLTLDNREIVRRHILAFLLQNYHQERLPKVDPDQRHDLFSVLGTVSEFRNGTSVLNRDDLAAWLNENEEQLCKRVSTWIPAELSQSSREGLLKGLMGDCLKAVDDAIRPGSEESDRPDEAEDDAESEVSPEEGEESPQQASRPENLLDRLLYCGKLPRYAFPTDVATFHVFDRDRSSRFRPIMRFAPQQSLPVALTQYAPGKQVWISGKCYTSGAIYSVMPDDRYTAWESKRIYMECNECGFARTFAIGEASRNEIRDCEACGGEKSFGPGRYWLRPPGFAHPIDLEEVTSPDDIPETSYATRAKLTMGTPDEEAGWVTVNERIRVLRARQHLLVSNTGPRREGYTYCTKCGRIEASTEPSPILIGPHRKSYPDDDDKLVCDGTSLARHIVLGTDFITDIALFSMRVAEPLNLKPGHSSTAVALRTVSEALAKAACQLLEIEPGELMAEFRPALTPSGIKGLEAEIFLYDTLPGGAGFSSQLVDQGLALFQRALNLMKSCPENCNASCYRCLRSFKNKFEHSLLDRHVGVELLEYLLTGQVSGFNQKRLNASLTLLYNDLMRKNEGQIKFQANTEISLDDGRIITAPILVEHNGKRFVIALSSPLTTDHPTDPLISELRDSSSNYTVMVVNELVVRGNLPHATRKIYQELER
ncbi:DEAD/DEAH box helicase [Desulfolutivibrio sp.]|uniref:DEAD/DEAH box helicase n=1 Tax=Desulfolutivibrio sp. TaxID=2773296 RepID=UPI002F9647FA